MEKIILNETPVRTAKNFNINNIELENIEIPKNIKTFNNVQVKIEGTTNIVEETETNINTLTYGIGDNLQNLNSNKSLKITIKSKTNQEILIDFNLDKDLIDKIEINAEEGANATLIIKYKSENDIKTFHNGIIKAILQKDSKINLVIVNLINTKSNNFLSIENELKANSILKYTIVDFGGKNSITNYYSNLQEQEAENELNTIYLGKDNQLFDLNYIGELRGEKSNINIEVQGALKDNAKKHFKGTIDFKKGCKKAKGDENEFCMLLSDTAKSLALPMLLCSEEDVEGNHSSAAGKVGEKELFYIMSRGFDKKEAMKLLVRAKFNKIIENIQNEELKNEILEEIDKRLD